MSNNDLFDGAQTQTPHVDPNKNYLEELVGDGKKFKTPEELARGKAESDAFITRLQQEAEGLRQELAQRARLGDLVDKLANAKPADPQPPVTTPNDEPPGTLDVKTLEEMVQNLLTQREQKSVAERNLDEVKGKLMESFGPGYADKLAQKANELGLSKEALNDLAAKSPAAFYTLVGVGTQAPKPPQGFVPPQSTRAPASHQGNPVDRTKGFYDNLKKTNPVLYWDKSTQQAMHKDAIRLGAAFFDN